MDFRVLSDDALLRQARILAEAERNATVELVACLAEIQRRELPLARGFSHLFDFCVRALRMSEGAAGRRVAAARASQRFAEALSLLADGSLTLSALARIEPYLHSQAGISVLFRAQGRDRRALDELIQELDAARSEAARQETARTTAGGEEAESLLPLAGGAPCSALSPQRASPDRAVRHDADRIRFSFDAGTELERKLERVGTLLSHRVASRRLEDLIDAMADIVIRGLDPALRRAAAPRLLKGNPRRVPWSVRKAVWERDGARCAYTAVDGTRCAATRRLQYDHVRPWALGGRSDDPANIRLLCRAHNLREGRRAFPAATARALAARTGGAEAQARAGDAA